MFPTQGMNQFCLTTGLQLFCLLKESFLTPSVWRYSLMFSSKSFQVLLFTFLALTFIELFLVCGMRIGTYFSQSILLVSVIEYSLFFPYPYCISRLHIIMGLFLRALEYSLGQSVSLYISTFLISIIIFTS